jgi:alpha-ribazole phosphatase
MTMLLLVRHGQTLWNEQSRYLGWSDLALNELGKRQTQALVEQLADREFKAIYSSDLQRATDVARAIARRSHRVVRPDSRLREMAFGSIEGLTFDEAQARQPARMSAWLSDVYQTLPDAEPYNVFSARISSFLADVRLKFPESAVLVVTHGGPIREILRQVLGLPAKGLWYFQIDLATISEIVLYESGPLLVRLNETVYLEIKPHGS